MQTSYQRSGLILTNESFDEKFVYGFHKMHLD